MARITIEINVLRTGRGVVKILTPESKQEYEFTKIESIANQDLIEKSDPSSHWWKEINPSGDIQLLVNIDTVE
jgi:hypothetical protein